MTHINAQNGSSLGISKTKRWVCVEAQKTHKSEISDKVSSLQKNLFHSLEEGESSLF